MTRREHRARERLITAELAIAELEASNQQSTEAVMTELRQSRLGLYQVVVARGRRG